MAFDLGDPRREHETRAFDPHLPTRGAVVPKRTGHVQSGNTELF